MQIKISFSAEILSCELVLMFKVQTILFVTVAIGNKHKLRQNIFRGQSQDLPVFKTRYCPHCVQWMQQHSGSPRRGGNRQSLDQEGECEVYGSAATVLEAC